MFHFYFGFLFYFFISFSKLFNFVRLDAFHTTATKRNFSFLFFMGGLFQNFNFHMFFLKNRLYQGVMGPKGMFQAGAILGNTTTGQ